jgi:predicted Rossmann fold flavoprotein
MTIAIIGGGPAGLMCAWQLAEQGLSSQITLYEKNERLGKKILASGGGMCNYTQNTTYEELLKHYGDGGKALKHLFKALDAKGLIALLERIDVKPWFRADGKVFVNSKKASDLVNALERHLKKLHVTVRLNQAVVGIEREESGYTLRFAKGQSESYDIIVVATGGKSYPSLGTSGDAYEWFRQLGVGVVSPRPALVPIDCRAFPQDLSGVVIKQAMCEILTEKHRKAFGPSELLVTHGGLSGPLVLNSSRYLVSGSKLIINFTGMSRGDFEDFLLHAIASHGKRQVMTILLELDLPESVTRYLYSKSGLSTSLTMSQLTKAQREVLMAHFLQYPVVEWTLGSYDKAMVTAGGVSLDCLNLKHFEVKSAPRLFAIGEVVDIDGDTGGYNIQAAFSMGYSAAKYIAKLSSSTQMNL